MEKLKRVVIKEELVALTGDFKKAITLSQMIYWAERVKDADKFMKDEIKRSQMAMGRQEVEYAEKLEEVDLLLHGWIYKSAEELSEETMMGVSKSTMGTYLNYLVENGWLNKRKNPKWKGDNTFQYRVDLLKIQKDLKELGFALEGYPLIVECENQTPMSDNQTPSSKIEQTVLKSNNQFGNQTTLPEITSESTSDLEKKEEEEEKVAPSELVSFLLTKDITLSNAIKFETRLLEKNLTGYTNEDVLEALTRSSNDFQKNICDEPYLWAVGKLERLLDSKSKGKVEKPTRKQKKPTRIELLPDWFDAENNPVAEELPSVDPVAKKQELNDMLKRLRDNK